MSKTIKNELSQEDIRTELRKQLVDKLGVDKYDIWISGGMVYDSYFIYELWNVSSEEYEYYKATFTRQGDVITVDVDNLEKVERKTVWVTVDEMNTVINQKDETIKILNSEKEDILNKFNEASEKVVNLNDRVSELQPIVDKYNEELEIKNKLEEENKLKEKRDYYRNRFEKLGAKTKFESEEIQSLVNNCIKDNEAISKLNSILVDLVDISSTEQKSVSNRVENVSNIGSLIDVEEDITSKYGFK